MLDSAEPVPDASNSREPTQLQQQGPIQPSSPEAMAEERTFLQTLREVITSRMFCLPEAIGLCWTLLRTIEEDLQNPSCRTWTNLMSFSLTKRR